MTETRSYGGLQMLSGLYSTARAMDLAETEHHVVARNLAHINLPGFRKQVASFENFVPQNQLVAESDAIFESQFGKENVTTNFEVGKYEHTSRSLDIAIQGDGFFEYASPTGPVYSRNGVLAVDADGQLSSMSGYPIQGRLGPIEIPEGTSPSQIMIGADGTVAVDGQPIDQIKVVTFEDNQQLRVVGDSLFDANGQAAVETEQPNVQQGYREHSNVDATTELVRMMIGMRHHEAAQRAMREISEAVQKHTTDQ